MTILAKSSVLDVCRFLNTALSSIVVIKEIVVIFLGFFKMIKLLAIAKLYVVKLIVKLYAQNNIFKRKSV